MQEKINRTILYFAPCRLDQGVSGGARLNNMVRMLGQLGYNIHLISYLPSDKFWIVHKQVNSHLDTITIKVDRTAPKILKFFTLGLILFYGLKYIRHSHIVFAHAPVITTGFPAFICAKLFRKPLVIDHIDSKDPDTPRFIYNLILKRADLVFVISKYLEAEVKAIRESNRGENIIYLPTLIDTDTFQKDALQRALMRAKLGIADEEIVIGYAGSFWYIEGLPFLLRAFKDLSRRYDNIRLVLIGGANVTNSDNVPQLINELGLNERVILIPFQPHELMPQYLSAFDIACSPKIDCEENRAANPIKIYEYMSMGIPMVVSAVGEVINVIENGLDGFLVKPGNEDDLKRKLEYIIRNMDSVKEVGERAREKVINNYSQKAMLKRIKDAISKLANP